MSSLLHLTDNREEGGAPCSIQRVRWPPTCMAGLLTRRGHRATVATTKNGLRHEFRPPALKEANLVLRIRQREEDRKRATKTRIGVGQSTGLFVGLHVFLGRGTCLATAKHFPRDVPGARGRAFDQLYDNLGFRHGAAHSLRFTEPWCARTTKDLDDLGGPIPRLSRGEQESHGTRFRSAIFSLLTALAAGTELVAAVAGN